ncbi:MAG: Fic family protein [Desulfamplus sp.]|nr:Fic family protein [Desulfamplus sp.]
MKMPISPPDITSIIKEDFQLILMIMKQGSLTDSKGRYLHWDKLRHYTPPKGLTNEQWWASIKLNRQNSYKKLPFKDKYKNTFSFCVTDLIQQETHWFDVHAAETISFNRPIANKETRNTYLIKSLVEESISSSQLEGATTTIKVAKEMIRQRREPRDKSERMIINNYFAMEFIREYKDDDLTPQLLFELHRILTEGTLDEPSKAGKLRDKNDNVCVVGRMGSNILHVPPDATELNDRINTICNFANNSFDSTLNFIHPVIRAIILHFILAYDHPFVDGNGRTARALFYWAMIKQGYWLTEFISISKIIKNAQSQYGKSFLYTETDDSDVTYFIIHQLEVIREAITSLYAYLEKKGTEIEHAKTTLRNAKYSGSKLNSRQLALLHHALKHSRFVYTIIGHKNSHNISYDTARKDLIQMSDKLNLLIKHKEGREFIFISPSDLEERISKLKTT